MTAPEGWKFIKLGEKANIFRGGSPRPIQAYLTTLSNGINWIKIGDVEPNAKFINTTNEKIIPEGTRWSREVKKGDFILSNSMSFGRPYILNVDGCIHDGWLVIQDYQNDFDQHYLYYALCSDSIIAQYKSMAAGSSVQNLSKEKVAAVVLLKPPLPEQRAIAKALSDTDGYIASLEKLIAKKKSIKQGAMQELLTGKRRLPGFEGEWVEKPICELADIISGGTPRTTVAEYWDGTIIWVAPTDITGQKQKYLKTSERKITELGLEQSAAVLLPKNTLLLCSRATIGELAIAVQPTATNQGFKNLVTFAGTDTEWLYYAIQPMKSKMIEQASGSTFLEISKTSLGNIEIITPPTQNEQSAIAAVLSDMDIEIETLTAKMNKAKLIKQGMMQELLTGKIRLVNTFPMQVEFTISEYMVILAVITKLFTDNRMKFLKHMRYQKLVYLYLVYKKAKTCIFEKWDYGPFSRELAYTIVPKAENEKSYIATDNDKNIRVGENINEAIENAVNTGYYKDVEQLAGKIRYKKDKELEVLATVIESIMDLEISQKAISLQTVKEYIGSIPIWKHKLGLEYFTDFAIDKSIKEYYDFFK